MLCQADKAEWLWEVDVFWSVELCQEKLIVIVKHCLKYRLLPVIPE